MISQDGWRLCVMYGEIVRISGMLHGHFVSIGQPKSYSPTGEEREIMSEIGDRVLGFALECSVQQEMEKLGLEASARLTQKLIYDMASRNLSLESQLEQLDSIRHTIEIEIGQRYFAYIPSPNDKYFEKDKLFGDDVHRIFPDARDEIKDAGNCIAASLPSAAMFHLMRIAELGLRRFAKKLRVTLKHSGKKMPLEFGEWDNVITEIQNKIKASRALPRGPKRQKQLEFYSDAADHCLFMKDIWRNTVSHARKRYKESEAIAAMDRVREFMQFLGKHL